MSTLAFHQAHYQQLAEPLLAIMAHGIRVDTEKAAIKRVQLIARCIEIQDRLANIAGANTCTCGHGRAAHVALAAPLALTKAGKPRKRQPRPTWPCGRCRACPDFHPAGHPLHGDTDLSSQRVITFLYETWAFPRQRKRGEENATADEVTMRKLALRAQAEVGKAHKSPPRERWKRDPEGAIEALTLLLEHREKAKLATYLDPDALDPDGRLRCMLKVTTENGRLASSKNPFGTGYNLQNIPRGALRECFLPDDGCVLLEVDYSQIEDRVVKVLTKDPDMIHEARLRPDVFDSHTAAAKRAFAQILRVPEAQVDVKVEVTPGNTRRQIFKPFNHGGNYGARAQRVQEMMLKDGVLLPLGLCTRLLDAAITKPKQDFQRETRRRIMRDKRLVNSWGRVLDFTGERLNDDTYRRGYAFRGASENADALNQLGLVPVYNFIQTRKLHSHVSLQVHDSIVLSVFPDEAWEILAFLVTSMEAEREYEGIKLAVPVEIKIGTTWKCEIEYKAIPTQERFEKDIALLLAKGKANGRLLAMDGAPAQGRARHDTPRRESSLRTQDRVATL